MGLAKEFRDFAMRGNVADMAIGIIIGGAFGKIVSSIVNDIIMPPIGLLIGGVDFTDLKINLKGPILDGTGKVVSDAVSLSYGKFLQTTVDFLIIAFAVFLVIKLMNRLKKKEEAKPAVPPAPPTPSTEEKLLIEIRDILKNK